MSESIPNRRQLIILGAGGAGLEALFVAQRMALESWTVIGFADDADDMKGKSLGGVPVLGKIEAVLQSRAGSPTWVHCAIGGNRMRQKLAAACDAMGFQPGTLIDPSAIVPPSASIGAGCYVAPHVFVGPEARIGRHCLINAGVSVGHHVICGDFAQICPGGRVSGACVLGEGAFLGSNGVLAPGVELGAWATLGAASFALKNVPPGVTAVGNPARACFQ